MNDSATMNRNLDSIAWGAIFIWWGITELFQFLPQGSGGIGIGLILLGVNAIRRRNDIPTNRFSTTLGILALVWGGLELAGALLSLPFEIPVFAIILIVLGATILAPALTKMRNN